ncbi:MAG: FtsW/RodA/SpoVE family cell cycle protein, partial [Lachnospiraceae bacterium]
TYLAIGRGWFVVRKKQALAILWGLAVLLPVLAGIWGFFLGGFAPYQIARIQAVVTPWVFPEEMGYMVGNIRDILSQSRLIGFGVETAGRVPGPHTDYVLLWIIAYYGILAGLGILTLLGGMVLRIFRNSSRQKNQLGFLTGTACGLVFLVEIVHYVMVNLGLSQMGLGGLPLLSYGRYQMLASYLLLGIALSVYRYKDIPKDGNIKVLS